MKFCLPLLFVTAVVFATGCHKDGYPYLKAVVTETHDMDCGYPALSFAGDSVTIRAIFHKSNLVYIAKGLPDDLNHLGQELLVQVAPLDAASDFVCTDFGIAIPHLKVLSAKGR
jgi:hypothetical protein